MPQNTARTIIKKSQNAIIGSLDDDGFPNIKAMLIPRESVGLTHFYFTTNTSSMRVSQFKTNPKGSVYFFSGSSFEGLMLLGHFDVLTDAASKERIWRHGDELYYPKGVTDPDYCVLKFTAMSGRIYGNFSSQSFPVA
jgi:general stress protein 26